MNRAAHSRSRDVPQDDPSASAGVHFLRIWESQYSLMHARINTNHKSFIMEAISTRPLTDRLWKLLLGLWIVYCFLIWLRAKGNWWYELLKVHSEGFCLRSTSSSSSHWSSNLYWHLSAWKHEVGLLWLLRWCVLLLFIYFCSQPVKFKNCRFH